MPEPPIGFVGGSLRMSAAIRMNFMCLVLCSLRWIISSRSVMLVFSVSLGGIFGYFHNQVYA